MTFQHRNVEAQGNTCGRPGIAGHNVGLSTADAQSYGQSMAPEWSYHCFSLQARPTRTTHQDPTLPEREPDSAASRVEIWKSRRASSTLLSVANGCKLIFAMDSAIRTTASSCLQPNMQTHKQKVWAEWNRKKKEVTTHDLRKFCILAMKQPCVCCLLTIRPAICLPSTYQLLLSNGLCRIEGKLLMVLHETIPWWRSIW